jgi:FKBP-type peptidyl-prolyl cis-trans isomerase (trigger factor)
MKLLISLFLVISLYAKVVDKIEILVNNIPITSYDIQQVESKLNMDKNKAISYLIDQAILKSAIKEKGIYVDDFDIDNEMEKIAKKNGMSLFNFKNYLLQKGQLEQLKQQIKLKLQKDKLLAALNVKVTREDVENYYKSHKNEYMLPKKIEATQYSAQNRDDLLQVIQNPLSQNPNVEIKDMTFDINQTNPRLMQFLAKVDLNSFSPIVNIQNRFVSFYVTNKEGDKPLPFDMVGGEIYQNLMAQKSQAILDDFISKLKAKADIQFLNKP